MTLSDYMAEHHLTEAEIARLANCSQGTVNKLRNGKLWPSADLARRIARATDNRVTPNDFAGIGEFDDEAAA